MTACLTTRPTHTSRGPPRRESSVLLVYFPFRTTCHNVPQPATSPKTCICPSTAHRHTSDYSMEHTNPTASVDADGGRASDGGSPGTAASDDVDVQFAPRAGTANGGDAPGTGAGAGVAAGVSGGGDDDNRRGSALSRRAAADAAAEYQQSEEVLAGLGVQRQRRSSMMAVRASKTFVDPVQGPTAVQRFADSTPFNTFIILCIVVNAVLIGASAAGDLACTLPDDIRRGAGAVRCCLFCDRHRVRPYGHITAGCGARWERLAGDRARVCRHLLHRDVRKMAVPAASAWLHGRGVTHAFV